MGLIGDIGLYPLLFLAVMALLTSSVHGATGVAGGFLMSAVLASVIGVKPVVPIMSVALLISHSSRALFNIRDFDRTAFFTIAIPAVPCIITGALLYGRMSSTLVAAVLGSVILLSIPIRRWAKSRKITAGRRTLGSAGAVYGGLSGVSIGPGMLLIPFMLGYGLSKEAFVATLAAIALTTNVTRVTVFGGTDLLDGRYLVLGLLIGLLTIPGNWIGRSVLRKMTGDSHSTLVDALTVVGALNFFWLAFH
ncbi:MAG: sulfite exporter TauE/SafE family protein [Pseudomonadota bacterium]